MIRFRDRTREGRTGAKDQNIPITSRWVQLDSEASEIYWSKYLCIDVTVSRGNCSSGISSTLNRSILRNTRESAKPASGQGKRLEAGGFAIFLKTFAVQAAATVSFNNFCKRYSYQTDERWKAKSARDAKRGRRWARKDLVCAALDKTRCAVLTTCPSLEAEKTPQGVYSARAANTATNSADGVHVVRRFFRRGRFRPCRGNMATLC
jgi:hypothetical protein